MTEELLPTFTETTPAPPDPHQFFPTPGWVTKAFLREKACYLPTRGALWLEPCAGDGAILDASLDYFAEAGLPAPTWSAIELQAPLAAKIAHKRPGIDLRVGSSLELDIPLVDVICTNPPFYLADQMFARFRPRCTWLIFLLRLGWLESGERQVTLAKDLPSVGMISPRPSFGGGNDKASYGWLVWGPEKKTESSFFMVRKRQQPKTLSLF